MHSLPLGSDKILCTPPALKIIACMIGHSTLLSIGLTLISISQLSLAGQISKQAKYLKYPYSLSLSKKKKAHHVFFLIDN